MNNTQPRYYLSHKLIGEKEVTVEQFMEAERQAGFHSKFPGNPATGGFGFGDIRGSVRYVTEPEAHHLDEDTLRDLASSAFETAMANGVNEHAFLMLARSVAALAAPVQIASHGGCAQCGASTVDTCNDNGCAYLENGNGAPVQSEREPIGYMRKEDLAKLLSDVTWDGTHLYIGIDHRDQWREDTPYEHLVPIYDAPVRAVKLPDRENENGFENDQSEQAVGFNRALDLVTELNAD